LFTFNDRRPGDTECRAQFSHGGLEVDHSHADVIKRPYVVHHDCPPPRPLLDAD
jgi:hypothetical protein